MNKFLVLYCTPVAVLDKWMQTPAEERKEMEKKMETDWNEWMASHKEHVLETAGAGKTKLVTASGTTDIKNDIMMYSLVQGESAESVAQMFEGHPHFGIPEATIQVMPANALAM